MIASKSLLFLAFGCLVAGSHGRTGRDAFFTAFREFFDVAADSEEKICYSEVCNSTARSIAASLDKSVDPCDDFYAFACNGWIKKHPIPPMSMNWNQFNELNEKLDEKLKAILSEGITEDDEEVVKSVKMLFEACMDEERIEERGVQPLLDLLKEFDGWPIISPTWDESKFRWQDLAAKVSKKIGITPLLAVGVDVDLRNTSRNVIIVSPWKVTQGRKSPINTPESYTFINVFSFMEMYSSHFSKVVKLLSRRKSKDFLLRFEIANVILFETKLNLLVKKKEEMRDLDKSHNPVTVKQLQKWTDERATVRDTAKINWKQYLQTLLDKDESEINEDTSVVVSDWEFLENLFVLISKTRPDVLANFILWDVVKTLMRITNGKMRELEFQFKKELTGVKEDIPRWQECVHATDDLAFAVGYIYVRKYFNDESKVKAIIMVENIRREFRKELSEVTWIDDQTKAAALEKADFMNHFIGYPDWYGNSTALEDYYKGLNIGRNHFENIIALRGFLANKHFKKLDKKTKRNEWSTGPAIINAYYDSRFNSILFPAGILESPFFNKDQPQALNYGSIGSIIGHEITHAFDVMGRQADKFGNIHQWWTKETENTYLDNTKCFIDEYGKFRFPELESFADSKVQLNGLLTLDENIADNGGLKTALRAYLNHGKRSESENLRLPGLEQYSSDQLFYLGFAMTWCETTSEESLINEVLTDTHSPHSVRVLGSLYNLEHFSKTWSCPRGSRMNPEKKCQLW